MESTTTVATPHRPLVVVLLLLVVLCGSLAEAAPRRAAGASAGRGKVARAQNPAVWQRVRKALLARPMDSYTQVARTLSKDRKLTADRSIKKIDAAFVTRLIDQHEGRQAVWAARDRAAAQRVAARVVNAPQGTNLRDMARLLSDELPGVRDHHLAKLKKRHPDILGQLAARSISKPVPPAARARIKELALAHPTLSYAQLAGVFKKDPQLASVLPWSEQQVSHLREPSRILPSETKRARALARLAAEHLSQLPSGSSLEAGVASLAKKHPGLQQATLVKLAPRTPELARAIRSLQISAGSTAVAGASVGAVDLGLARQLKVGPLLIQRSLQRPDSELVRRYSTQLKTLEREAGDNDGRLSPRDLAASNDPHLAAVMKRVYRQTGRKQLPLAEVCARLPAAIAAAAHQGRLKRNVALAPLFREAVAETMGELSSRYRAEVLGGTRSASGFAGAVGLSHRDFLRLQQHLPGAFPRPGSITLTGKRLAGVASLYRKLLAGELTTTGFYQRAKITADQLRLLQTSDPHHFPRPAGTPSWKTVAGRRGVDHSQSNLQTLSAAWHEQVLGGARGVNQFKRDHGISHHRLTRLYNEHPELFPRKGQQRSVLRAGTPMAHDVGLRASALFSGDVLLRQAEIIRAINSDPAYVAQHGKLTRNRYEQLHAHNPHLFPQLSDTKQILAHLAAEVHTLLRRQPNLSPTQLTVQMQLKHPGFKKSRVYQLRKAYPELIPSAASPEVPARQRKADAARLAKLMSGTSGGKKPTVAVIARQLSAEHPRFSREYLYRLRREFEQQHFSKGQRARRPQVTERSNRVVAQLYALAIRLSAPGTSEGTLRDSLNRMLEQRGLPAFTGRSVPRNIQLRTYGEHGNLKQQNARVVAQVVAEYARSAARGTTEKQILQRVLADYPTLNHKKLNAYRALWKKHPADYPALAPFAGARGKLAISGQGRRRGTARYLGGWDVNSAVLKVAAQDRQLAHELANLSQYVRMPLRLPLLDHMVADLQGKKPLRNTNVLWVSHLLATSVPLAGALRSAGTLAKSTIVVGTPYGTNPAVHKTLAKDGFDVRVPTLSVAAYEKEVKRAVDDMVAKHRRNHKPVVVLDDGGLVTKILHSDVRYADVLGAFKIVEQTTRGITLAEQQQLKLPVINVARSMSKRAEGVFIGQAVAAKVLQGLRRSGRKLAGARVTVMGYGIVGQAVAAELKRAGAHVTIVETSGQRARAARKARFSVTTKDRALPASEVVIGATGHQSLSLADLRKLPGGATVASASSKQVELDMAGLRKAASWRKLVKVDNPLVRLPTARYKLGRAEITVLGDGWPVNFDGDVEDIPARHIQLTRAVMFAGALQAAGVKTNHLKNRRLMPLDRQLDRQILRRFKSLQKRQGAAAEIHDPARWMEVIQGVASLVSQSR